MLILIGYLSFITAYLLDIIIEDVLNALIWIFESDSVSRANSYSDIDLSRFGDPGHSTLNDSGYIKETEGP